MKQDSLVRLILLNVYRDITDIAKNVIERFKNSGNPNLDFVK